MRGCAYLIGLIELAGAGILLREPEGARDDNDLLVNRGELAAELLEPAPVVPVEAIANLGADVGQVEGIAHCYNEIQSVSRRGETKGKRKGTEQRRERARRLTKLSALVVASGDHVTAVISGAIEIRIGDPEHLRDHGIRLELDLVTLGLPRELLLGEMLRHPARVPEAAVI